MLQSQLMLRVSVVSFIGNTLKELKQILISPIKSTLYTLSNIKC